MSLYLQFGAGPHKHLQIGPPWQNFDIEVDIRQKLPFPRGSAKFILAEHVIEHVQFSEGLKFLQECYRILEPGGVLRISFPDILRIDRHAANLYSDHVRKYGLDIPSPEAVWYSMATDWGHLACWTSHMAIRLMKSIGFATELSYYGSSLIPELDGIDRHHNDVGFDLACAESTVIEATK